MATGVRSNGRKVRQSYDIRHRVGEFFEATTLHIIGGTRNREDDRRLGDIINWGLGLGVEVKAGNNKQAIGIPINQKDEHCEMIPFPLDCIAYMLCCYRGQKKDRTNHRRFTGIKSKTFSVLNRFTKRGDHHRALSEIISDQYLLDIEIINALDRKLPRRMSKQPPRTGMPEIGLLRQHLYGFRRAHYADTIISLGLDRKDWCYGQYEIDTLVPIVDPDYLGLKGERVTHLYPVKFTLYTVLSNVPRAFEDPPQSFNEKFVSYMIARGYTPSL